MGYHPIHYAVAGKKLGAMKLLVGSGANVEDHMELLDHWSADTPELKRYLKSLDGTRKAGKRSRDTPAVDKSVPEIDRPDWMGFPPLVEACRGNHNAPDDPTRVTKLLKRGANVNIIDHKQKTPLHRSSQAGFMKITALLLQHGALLEAVDEKGCTPIFDAAHHGRTPVVQLLLENGANLSHTDQRGETPLFAAARGGRDETFAFLLDSGADPSLKNKRGQSLAEIVSAARMRTPGRQRILEILQAR